MDPQTITSNNNPYIDQFYQGFVRVRRSDNAWGFFDRKGVFYSSPIPAAILGNFQEGLAGVCLPSSGIWGFIDRTMRWVFPPKSFTYMDDGFSEGIRPGPFGRQNGGLSTAAAAGMMCRNPVSTLRISRKAWPGSVFPTVPGVLSAPICNG